jgi:hypothetical protein
MESAEERGSRKEGLGVLRLEEETLEDGEMDQR